MKLHRLRCRQKDGLGIAAGARRGDELRRADAHDRLEFLVRNDGAFDDRLGRVEIAFHQQRGERQDFADVIEPEAGVVGGKVGSRLELDAAQVADRVVVFHAVQTPKHHKPRIARLACIGERLRGRRR